MTQLILFCLLMCADLTLTHINMKNYRKISDRYWEPERNFVIRSIYKRFRNMKVAFTMTLVYSIPWLVVIYYLFIIRPLNFIIAFFVYLIVFIIHTYMAYIISRAIAYRMMLKDMGVRQECVKDIE